MIRFGLEFGCSWSALVLVLQLVSLAQTFDGDKTITKDRPRLKRTTKLNATIVFLHTAIIKSHFS